jgi:superfamily II DNA or RNA helicase
MTENPLFGYQLKMVARHEALLNRRGVTADRSDAGVGKTPVALKTAEELGQHFIVVCPKSIKSHWKRWVSDLGLGTLCLGVMGWEEAKLGLRPELFDRYHWPRIEEGRLLIIFDEAHRAKNHKTMNAKMVARAREQGHLIALLSATLIQSPLDLGGLSYPLGLVSSPRYWFAFARQYGAGLNQWKGYDDFATQAQRKSLHELLDKVSVRVRKADVAPKMCLSQADLIDVDNLEAIRSIYLALEAEIRELYAKKAAAVLVVTARLRARQAVELQKVSTFVDLAFEHLEAGSKVALFFNFTQSIEWAAHAFEERGVRLGVITGQTSACGRDAAMAGFNGEDFDVLVLNIAAGGEGISLHDATGNKPRVCLLSPPESATVLVQALGRVDRVGAKSVALNRVLFCANTIEVTVYENVRRKIRNLVVLNDGDLAFDFFPKEAKS